jgi:predicted Zn-dependent peptidase
VSTTLSAPVEPVQEGERRVIVEADAEPSLLMGFHRPDMNHPDAAALTVASYVLGSGRTSRLDRDLVDNRAIAVSVFAGESGPGERDANLFLLGGAPRPPRTNRDVEKALLENVSRLAAEGPTADELTKVKNNIESSVIRTLSSNLGLAEQLAYYEAVSGHWENLLQQIKDIDAVTSADVQRVVKTYLTPSNMTVAYLERKK